MDNPDFKLRSPTGDEHQITGPFRIGRDPECDIQLDNALASRIHASIWIDHGQLLVRDERSHNGTSVNGHRLPPGAAHRLFAGDKVEIAGTTYTVESPPAPEQPPTLSPSPGFVLPPRAAPAPGARGPGVRLAVAGGCAVLIIVLLCCIAGGFILAGPGRPIIATALAPHGALIPGPAAGAISRAQPTAAATSGRPSNASPNMWPAQISGPWHFHSLPRSP